ncbi:MAG: hypothetical protein QXD09_06455 [Candidatus Caldarchaeum sp.]
MSEKELERLIKDWFKGLGKEAPECDPRRTPQCPSIPELVTYAHNGVVDNPERREHIASCAFCQSAITIACRVLEEQRLMAQTSDEVKVFSKALRERLHEWVAKQPAEQDCPAHFNEQGVLQVYWRGLPREGHVKVSLIWGETPLPLGSGIVRDGTLTFSRPLPHLGLRNISIPRSLLHLEWEPDTGSQQPNSAQTKRRKNIIT